MANTTTTRLIAKRAPNPLASQPPPRAPIRVASSPSTPAPGEVGDDHDGALGRTVDQRAEEQRAGGAGGEGLAQPALRLVALVPAMPQQADLDRRQLAGEATHGEALGQAARRHEAARQHGEQIRVVNDARGGRELGDGEGAAPLAILRLEALICSGLRALYKFG